VIEIVIGGAIVRIAVGTDAATLQTVLRARRCRKLTACVISCGSCGSRNSVGVRKLDPEQPTLYEKAVRAWTVPHFSHHPTSVCLHSDLADAELKINLLIQHTADNQRHDLSFAPAE
jgi:hypothetical protein